MVDITVYWRPGCMYCTGLMRQLDRLTVPYQRVNIWAEPEAAAIVRQADRGNETVPAVRVGDVILSNPSAHQVLATAHRIEPGTDLPTPPRPRGGTRWLWRLLGGGDG
jgi:mycoredoxin